MSVKRFVKGLLHPRNDFDFHSLKSNSSVELSQYVRTGGSHRGGNRPKSHLPRYYSHYDQLSRSASPLSQTSGTAEMVVVPSKCDHLESFAICLSFLHSNSNPPVNQMPINSNEDYLLSEDSYFGAAIDTCCQLKNQRTFHQGLLLKCTDPQSPFPYLHYVVYENEEHCVNPAKGEQFQKELAKAGQTDHLCIKQTFGLYEEIASVLNKNETIHTRMPGSKYCGYIVIGCKVLGINDTHQLEESWVNWSGAREICKYSPKSWQLRRITFHRQQSTTVGPDSFVYVILCEYANLLSPGQLMAAFDFVARLRTRNCGYVGLYRVQWVYESDKSAGAPLPAGIVRLEEAQCRLKSTGNRSLLVETDQNFNDTRSTDGSQLTLNTFDGDLLCD